MSAPEGFSLLCRDVASATSIYQKGSEYAVYQESETGSETFFIKAKTQLEGMKIAESKYTELINRHNGK